jgi:SAM-dependent methyltransferase
VLRRFQARQFARPSGWIGRRLIAPWLDRISAPMRRLVLERLDPRPGERVLDLGFGGGGLLADLLRRGCVVVGVDVSQAAVARARRRFPAAELCLASAERLPLNDASVDKAASLNSLYFWPDAGEAMGELARVIRPGGRLVLAFEPPEELRKWPGHRFGFRLYAEAEVRAMLAAAGFDEIGSAWGTGRKPDRFLCLTARRPGGEAEP